MKARPLPGALRRIVDRYVRAFAPARIVLFGSYAKGTPRPGSDMDLLVVADVEDDHIAQMRRAHQLAVDCYPPVDVVFAAPDELESPALERNAFLVSVLRTGIVLYP